MRRAAIRSAVPATRLVAAVLAGSTALTLAFPTWGATAQAAARHRATGTTITIQAGQAKGRVPVHQLGVNHRFVDNGHGMWDPATDAPNPVVMQRLKAAGVNDIRYPGGIVGNLFDWKDAIDRPGVGRGCQTHGQWTPQGFGRVRGNSYGVDEHMQVTEQLGAQAVLMVPFITETPSDAADWVEYMNSPADGQGGSNPNGGFDWAQLRADNGHPQPYRVKWWEIGNEQRINHQRYWLSKNMKTALHQYIHGATIDVNGEMLGRNCMQWNRGSRSSARPGQVFQLLYPPAQNVHVQVLNRLGDPVNWTDAGAGGLQSFGQTDQVYSVNAEEGEVTFGDGANGAILPKGFQVRASYTSVHKGVFSFIKAMRAVDPKIKSCVTWGLQEFIKAAGNRKYNCFTVHAYTHFKSEGHNHWATPLQGHDWHMLGTNNERNFVAKIKRALPRGTSLALTEFGTIFGDSKTYPEWTGSMTRATYMASMWVNWLNLGIPLAAGGDMLAKKDRALLGPAPDFAMSAEALTREAIKPLYTSASRRLGVGIRGNPRRFPTKRVRARVDLRGFASRRVAFISRVNGASYRSWNTARVNEVHLGTGRRRIGRTGFTEVFPAHSVTVIRVPAARRR